MEPMAMRDTAYGHWSIATEYKVADMDMDMGMGILFTRDGHGHQCMATNMVIDTNFRGHAQLTRRLVISILQNKNTKELFGVFIRGECVRQTPEHHQGSSRHKPSTFVEQCS